MLFTNGSNFPYVVDKTDIALCCTVAFTDSNISKSLQEIRPGVGSDSVSDSQSHFMILVVVFLE